MLVPNLKAFGRRVLSRVRAPVGELALVLLAGTVLLVLYPDEVIRAVIGSVVLAVLVRRRP